MPGSYNVVLLADGKSVDTKPMRIIMDPQVQFADAQRKRYNDIVMDLHEMQGRATEVANALNALNAQMTDAATKVAASSAPATVKPQFETLNRDFTAVRAKFGVPFPAPAAAGGRGGGGGGGFGGGAAPDPQNLLARAGTVKTQIMSIWEPPSEALVRQYTEVKASLPKAITDANAILQRARAMSQTLGTHGVTLTVPPAR